MTKSGGSAIFQTAGNDDCHVILRGGKSHTNYDAASVDDACALLVKSGLPERVMIDCSHANSNKDHRQQMVVIKDVAARLSVQKQFIGGLMIESHLIEGKQNPETVEELVYGQSITDACIGWSETETALETLHRAMAG